VGEILADDTSRNHFVATAMFIGGGFPVSTFTFQFSCHFLKKNSFYLHMCDFCSNFARYLCKMAK
jgi:uncharacterized protein YozE (UPF0346 family)